MSGLFSMDAWSTVWNHKESFLLGLGNTLQTAVCALALAFAIGALLGLMATSGNKILKFVARVYVEFIQNTPLLLQLCFLYYALAFAGLSLGVIRTGIIALGVYTGAYMGEVVRAAIESVPKGQFEAAQAQGFNYLQRMGYIILPQSIPVMLPPMTVSWPAGSMSSSPVVISLLLRMTTAVPSPVLLTTRLLPEAPIRLLILAPSPSSSPGVPARLTVKVWPLPMTTPA